MNNNFEYIKLAIPQIASIQANSSKMIKYIKECVEYVEQGIDFVANFLQGYAIGLNIDTSNQNKQKTNYENICYQSNLKELEKLNEQSEELINKFANR